jgi:hypothetical protein
MAGLWYRAGTVSVTNGSKKVTGFGSQFKTSTYKPDKGHAFYGPDGKAYEIDYVESDTVLYLVKSYAGATAAGQPYEIDITRTGTIPALSREVSAMLAYAQGQYDGWQQILTGSGNVSLFAPDGQSVTVPALSNMLSKSGNLAGLTDKKAARANISALYVGASGGADCNTLREDGEYLMQGTEANWAFPGVGGKMHVFEVAPGSYYIQEAVSGGSGASKVRIMVSGSWGAWTRRFNANDVGTGSANIAAGDHAHVQTFIVGDNPDYFYPVAISGADRAGFSITRDIHEDGTWAGSMRFWATGIGNGYGGDAACVDFRFSQNWGGGNIKGCLADVATSAATSAIYVWLRGGRTYHLHGAGTSATVYIVGITDATGAYYGPKLTGPLSATQTGNWHLSTTHQTFAWGNFNQGIGALTATPVWDGDNLPITSGTWTPYFDDPTLSITGATATWRRVGNVYNLVANLNISGAGSLAGNRAALRGLPFNFGNLFRPVDIYESNLLSGTPNKSAAAIAMVTASEIQFFYKTTAGTTAAVLQEQVRPNANGNIELFINATIVL